jgi:hypothetical protein
VTTDNDMEVGETPWHGHNLPPIGNPMGVVYADGCSITPNGDGSFTLTPTDRPVMPAPPGGVKITITRNEDGTFAIVQDANA